VGKEKKGTDFGRLGLADFDIALEHLRVHKAQVECGDRHHGGNRSKVEDRLVFYQAQVIESITCVTQCVEDHRALHPLCTLRLPEELEDAR